MTGAEHYSKAEDHLTDAVTLAEEPEVSAWHQRQARVHAAVALADAAAQPAALTPAQLRIVLDALADAQTYREREGSMPCTDCLEAPPSAGLCAEHEADFAAAQAYCDLTGELGGGES